MSRYKFIPNELAKAAFNLVAPEYVGEGVTPLMEGALGQENYKKYWVAQDPFSGGAFGEVQIAVNPEENNPVLKRFEPIGTIYKLDNAP